MHFLGDMFAVFKSIIHVNYNQYISIYFLYYDAKSMNFSASTVFIYITFSMSKKNKQTNKLTHGVRLRTTNYVTF